MAGDRESVIKSGCNAYLSKPIDTHELLEMIAETLLKRKHQSNDGEK
jgi:CheY-like chemotaxis protein